MLSVVGALSFGLAGLAVEHRWIRFSSGGAMWSRIARSAVGLATTVGLFIALDLLYDVATGGSTGDSGRNRFDRAGIGALVIYVVRYGIVAFWAIAGAPAMFRLVGLADSE